MAERSAAARRMVRDLKKALRRRGLRERKKLETFLAEARKPSFIIRPLRIAQHFDLDADVWIYSRRLSALGVVHVFDADEEVENRVRRCVDQAAYLRHLLLTDRELGDAQAVTVELVFVTTHRGETLGQIGRSLGDLARETEFLHALSVSVLPYRGGGAPFRERDLDRSLCWLLQKTEAWHRSNFAKPTGGPEHRRISSLELENYRLPGRRRLELHASDDLRFHLLHGRNGSGKSTLAEALELLWTGRLERLGDPETTDYQRVVRYRDPAEMLGAEKDPARITLRYQDSEYPILRISSDEIRNVLPVPGSLKAISFRLDQTVMNRLTQLGDDVLSRTFLEGFFPEESARFEEFERARQDAKSSFEALPGEIRGELEEHDEMKRRTALRRRLSWIGSGEPVTAKQLADCLPVSTAAIKALEPLTGRSLNEALDPVGDPSRTLERIDEALVRLVPKLDAHLDTLHVARAALDELGDWEPEDGETTGEFSGLLNRWLELLALADLAARHEELARSLSEAERSGWKMPWEDPVGLFAQSLSRRETEDLRGRAAEWAQERDRTFQEVMAAAREGLGAGSAEEKPRRFPNGAEISALDAVGPWVLAADAEALGASVDRAARRGEHHLVSGLNLGREGWRDVLGERLDSLISAFQELNQLDEVAGQKSAAGRFRLFREAFRKHETLEEKGREVQRTFLRKIVPEDGNGRVGDPILNEALNELMALFTPARWAYDDIAITYQTDQKGEQRVAVNTGHDGVPARLLLNTAELNLFTVALFLLCAVRLPNPHRLLILDDPLQNMDEMTVTTLARGLAKSVRLLPEGWQLFLLFKGEDDLERFRREVPAAVYFLSWLSPSGDVEGETEIRSHPGKSRLSGRSQELANLLQMRH